MIAISNINIDKIFISLFAYRNLLSVQGHFLVSSDTLLCDNSNFIVVCRFLFELIYIFPGLGCFECERYHWTSIGWEGTWCTLPFSFSVWCLIFVIYEFKLFEQSGLWTIRPLTICKYNAFLKDPTAQTEIDTFMVQQLDGTSNEWGWCKQKVPC